MEEVEEHESRSDEPQPVEFQDGEREFFMSDDLWELNEEDWLNIPSCFVNPLKICGVNQFVHVMSPEQIGDPYISYSAELSLVGVGTQIPLHFRWMVYCVWVLNQVSSLKGSFVPYLGVTKGVHLFKNGVKAKNFDVVGIERLVVPDASHVSKTEEHFIKTLEPVRTFQSMCSLRNRSEDRSCYARVKPIELQWGIIPVQYVENGKLVHRIFQVLRVIPQPGLHLMDMIRQKFIDRRLDSKLRDQPMVNDVCHYLQCIINHEADVNYKMIGVWGPNMPNPWTVTDAMHPTSVESILSPFTVLRRIINHLPGGFRGQTQTLHRNILDDTTLIINGFPDISTPENATEVLQRFDKLHMTYLKHLVNFEREFAAEIILYMRDETVSKAFDPILRSPSGRNLNRIQCGFSMMFTLHNYMKFSEKKVFQDAERFMIPKLGLAAIDHFLFHDLDNQTNMEEFVRMYVGENLSEEVATATVIGLKYRIIDAPSIEDFPKARMFQCARDSLMMNIKSKDNSIVNDGVANMYVAHMKAKLAITMNGLLMDVWMSDRVYRAALIIDQLQNQKCPCLKTREAVEFYEQHFGGSMMSPLYHDETSRMWGVLTCAMCELNVSLKANPLNLNLVWGIVKSDVLTYLGLHNQTWRWFMFCMQVAPCYGHLRALTQDGHAKSEEVPYTAKPNSVGLNEVACKGANACLVELLAKIISLSDEDRRVLRLDKVDRKTRPGIEDEKVSVCVVHVSHQSFYFCVFFVREFNFQMANS